MAGRTPSYQPHRKIAAARVKAGDHREISTLNDLAVFLPGQGQKQPGLKLDAEDADAGGGAEFAGGEAVVLVDVGVAADGVHESDIGADADELGAGDDAVLVLVDEEEAALVAAGIGPFDEGDLTVLVAVGDLEGAVGVFRGESLEREGNIPIRGVFRLGRMAGGQDEGQEREKEGCGEFRHRSEILKPGGGGNRNFGTG